MTLLLCLRPEKHTAETTHDVLSFASRVRDVQYFPVRLTDLMRGLEERWRKVVEKEKLRQVMKVTGSKGDGDDENDGEDEWRKVGSVTGKEAVKVQVRFEKLVRQMGDQITALRAKNKELEKKMDESETVNGSLKEENERVTRLLRDVQREFGEFMDEKETYVNNLTKRVVKLEEENEGLRSKVSTFTKNEDISRRRVEEAENHHDAMRMELDVVQKNFALLRRDYEEESKRNELISLELLAHVNEKVRPSYLFFKYFRRFSSRRMIE